MARPSEHLPALPKPSSSEEHKIVPSAPPAAELREYKDEKDRATADPLATASLIEAKSSESTSAVLVDREAYALMTFLWLGVGSLPLQKIVAGYLWSKLGDDSPDNDSGQTMLNLYYLVSVYMKDGPTLNPIPKPNESVDQMHDRIRREKDIFKEQKETFLPPLQKWLPGFAQKIYIFRLQHLLKGLLDVPQTCKTLIANGQYNWVQYFCNYELPFHCNNCKSADCECGNHPLEIEILYHRFIEQISLKKLLEMRKDEIHPGPIENLLKCYCQYEPEKVKAELLKMVSAWEDIKNLPTLIFTDIDCLSYYGVYLTGEVFTTLFFKWNKTNELSEKNNPLEYQPSDISPRQTAWDWGERYLFEQISRSPEIRAAFSQANISSALKSMIEARAYKVAEFFISNGGRMPQDILELLLKKARFPKNVTYDRGGYWHYLSLANGRLLGATGYSPKITPSELPEDFFSLLKCVLKLLASTTPNFYQSLASNVIEDLMVIAIPYDIELALTLLENGVIRVDTAKHLLSKKAFPYGAKAGGRRAARSLLEWALLDQPQFFASMLMTKNCDPKWVLEIFDEMLKFQECVSALNQHLSSLAINNPELAKKWVITLLPAIIQHGSIELFGPIVSSFSPWPEDFYASPLHCLQKFYPKEPNEKANQLVEYFLKEVCWKEWAEAKDPIHKTPLLHTVLTEAPINYVYASLLIKQYLIYDPARFCQIINENKTLRQLLFKLQDFLSFDMGGGKNCLDLADQLIASNIIFDKEDLLLAKNFPTLLEAMFTRGLACARKAVECLTTQDLIDAIPSASVVFFRKIFEEDSKRILSVDSQGNLFLHHAVIAGRFDLVELILENSARLNINKKNATGDTPLQNAISILGACQAEPEEKNRLENYRKATCLLLDGGGAFDQKEERQILKDYYTVYLSKMVFVTKKTVKASPLEIRTQNEKKFGERYEYKYAGIDVLMSHPKARPMVLRNAQWLMNHSVEQGDLVKFVALLVYNVVVNFPAKLSSEQKACKKIYDRYQNAQQSMEGKRKAKRSLIGRKRGYEDYVGVDLTNPNLPLSELKKGACALLDRLASGSKRFKKTSYHSQLCHRMNLFKSWLEDCSTVGDCYSLAAQEIRYHLLSAFFLEEEPDHSYLTRLMFIMQYVFGGIHLQQLETISAKQSEMIQGPADYVLPIATVIDAKPSAPSLSLPTEMKSVDAVAAWKQTVAVGVNGQTVPIPVDYGKSPLITHAPPAKPAAAIPSAPLPPVAVVTQQPAPA